MFWFLQAVSILFRNTLGHIVLQIMVSHFKFLIALLQV
jgi:hypothetical protein